MIRDLLNSISGIEIWPILAFFIFVALFAGVIVWTIRLDKRMINRMKELPLDSENQITNGD